MLYYITSTQVGDKAFEEEEAALLMVEAMLVSKCGDEDLKCCGTSVK